MIIGFISSLGQFINLTPLDSVEADTVAARLASHYITVNGFLARGKDITLYSTRVPGLVRERHCIGQVTQNTPPGE